MGKRQISAKAILADIKDGMTDEGLMDRYSLPSAGLQSLFKKMMEAGLLTQEMLDDRSSGFTLFNDVSPPDPTVIARKSEPIKGASHQDPKDMGGFDWYLTVLKNYAVFTGRARRREFWMFSLVDLLIILGLVVIDTILGIPGALATVYCLARMIPSIAVSIRRLHDINMSGWHMLIWLIPLINLLLLIFWAQDSQAGDNQYGPNPKGIQPKGLLR